jgi:hypothetical protein
MRNNTTTRDIQIGYGGVRVDILKVQEINR